MNFDELKSRDIKELRKLAAQYGIKTGPRSKPETVAKLIVEHATKPPTETMKHPAEKKQEPMVIHSEDEIRELVAPYIKKEGFLAHFPGDDTVIFQYKGSEESIHLSAALRIIKMKADSVSRGARRLFLKKDDPVNSSYFGDKVMMV